MPLKFWSALVLALTLLAAPLTAQPPADANAAAAKPDKGPDKKPAPPEEKSSRTQHSITLDGQKIPYTATAGTILLKDDDGTVRATVFSISYTRDGVKDPGTRPVTFSFNGGPGSASLWVHMGAFGPKRVERDPEGMSMKPPGRLIDNDLSILDLTDLVFIDPVDTGYSRAPPAWLASSTSATACSSTASCSSPRCSTGRTRSSTRATTCPTSSICPP